MSFFGNSNNLKAFFLPIRYVTKNTSNITFSNSYKNVYDRSNIRKTISNLPLVFFQKHFLNLVFD